jgi:chemotaxis protein MotB
VARKKHHGGHENHERWLVSYADFITLLFAFFVVMFASSQTDKGKAQQVSESVKTAMENGGPAAAVREILGGSVDEKGKGNAQMKGPGGAQAADHNTSPVPAELLPSMKYLSKSLEAEIQQGKVDIHVEPRGLVVSLRQATFFPSGEDAIDPDTFGSIEKIAKMLREMSNSVRLEGHTDSVPIHTTRFRSNWELSAARGISMMELLETRFGVPRNRMAIGGYADTAPVESNDTEAGRRRNRRVDIVILHMLVAAPAPPAQTATNIKPEAPGARPSAPKTATP